LEWPVCLCLLPQIVKSALPCRRFRDILLEPTKVWERLDNGFAAAFWRPEGL